MRSGSPSTIENPAETVYEKQSKRTWAKLIQKVYEVDPLVCENCGSEMRIVSVITTSAEIGRILDHLKRNKAPPFDREFAEAS